MTPQEYVQAALRTESTPDIFGGTAEAKQMARLLHGALGVGTEGGELENALKRALFYKKPIDKLNVLEEIGDTLWYLAILIDALGSSFEEAFERNIAKLRARYPEKFDETRAIVRDLDAERKALEGDA